MKRLDEAKQHFDKLRRYMFIKKTMNRIWQLFLEKAKDYPNGFDFDVITERCELFEDMLEEAEVSFEVITTYVSTKYTTADNNRPVQIFDIPLMDRPTEFMAPMSITTYSVAPTPELLEQREKER
jgi:hypothetical protein